MKPVLGEEKYIEFDEEFGAWSVFGLESGFCYGEYLSEEGAETALYGYVED